MHQKLKNCATCQLNFLLAVVYVRSKLSFCRWTTMTLTDKDGACILENIFLAAHGLGLALLINQFDDLLNTGKA